MKGISFILIVPGNIIVSNFSAEGGDDMNMKSRWEKIISTRFNPDYLFGFLDNLIVILFDTVKVGCYYFFTLYTKKILGDSDNNKTKKRKHRRKD
jgi:hypothetical protein